MCLIDCGEVMAFCHFFVLFVVPFVDRAAQCTASHWQSTVLECRTLQVYISLCHNMESYEHFSRWNQHHGEVVTLTAALQACSMAATRQCNTSLGIQAREEKMEGHTDNLVVAAL